MIKIATLRSRVGTYHKGYTQGGAFCNSRMGVYLAKDSDILKAAPKMFCEKCFPDGKPE